MNEQWQGTIQHNEESLEVKLTLSDNNGQLSGRLEVVDSVNSQLLRMGEITGSKTDNTITLETDTNLQITANLTTNLLTGTIVFPTETGEPGLEADINLTLVENNNVYLPIIIR